MMHIEDLPTNVAEFIDRFEAEATALRERFDEEIQRIRDAANREVDLLRRKCDEKVQVKATALIDQIRPLQAARLKEGDLDAALAIREALRQLRALALNALPDPGNLLAYEGKIDQEFIFEVTGATQGALWGSDVYTLDSSLACAVVHAGALAAGQKGAVRVTIHDTSEMFSFDGSARNGAFSYAWGPYPVGFRVAKAD